MTSNDRKYREIFVKTSHWFVSYLGTTSNDYWKSLKATLMYYSEY
jgi:hypothetical protein